MVQPPQYDPKAGFGWRANPKQGILRQAVGDKIAQRTEAQIIGAYGSARSGKTSCILVLLYMLCCDYPGSRWAVIRESDELVSQTSIPSFEKIFPEEATPKIKRWIKSSGRQAVYFKNGSVIFFKSSKASKDPEKEFKFLNGFEVNGIFLEQLEEHPIELWNKCIERIGSWYIDPMPPAFLFWTVNPALGWVKDKIYDPHQKGTLDPNIVAVEILAEDSPFITADQWRNWQNSMDPLAFRRFIKGDWTAFPRDNTWIYTFDEKRFLTKGLKIDFTIPIYLSFDFNNTPMTCLVEQHGWDWMHFPKLFSRADSNIQELCNELVSVFGYANRYITVTGDGTGHNKHSVAPKDRNTHYKEIQRILGLQNRQFRVMKRNPYHAESRIYMNALLHHFPEMLIDEDECKALITDIRMTRALPDGGIDKKHHDPHNMDAWRYSCHMWHREWYERNKYGRA